MAGGRPVRDVAVVMPTDATVVLERLADDGFLGGIAATSLVEEGDGAVDASVLDRTIVMAATERRTAAEVAAFAEALNKAVR